VGLGALKIARNCLFFDFLILPFLAYKFAQISAKNCTGSAVSGQFRAAGSVLGEKYIRL
jgi:hypothetical protein